MYPEDLKYTKTHEWARMDKEYAVVGITYYAKKQLREEIIYVELPKPGAEVKAGEAFAVVESTKAVADVFAPVDGKVTEVNQKLSQKPELVSKDPYGEGWIAKIKITNPSQLDALLDSREYEKLVSEGE